MTLPLSALALLVWFIPGANEVLQFDRAAIEGGQWPRLITGHWTHWSVDMLFWDTLAFAVLGALCERANRRRFAITVAASALLIPLVLWFVYPQLNLYRGLSGLDSALFFLLAAETASDALRKGDRFLLAVVATAALGFAGKIAWESIVGAAFFAPGNGEAPPIPLTHLIGALVGVAVAFDSEVRAALRIGKETVDSPQVGA